jgi:hypothetical protein
MAVEWQRKKPCEKLHEDDQIRILRCTFPPGGQASASPRKFRLLVKRWNVEVLNASGTRQVETVTDAATLSPAIPWHEVTNIADTTLSRG